LSKDTAFVSRYTIPLAVKKLMITLSN